MLRNLNENAFCNAATTPIWKLALHFNTTSNMNENTTNEREIIDEAESTPESRPRRMFIAVIALAVAALLGIAVLVWLFSGGLV